MVSGVNVVHQDLLLIVNHLEGDRLTFDVVCVLRARGFLAFTGLCIDDVLDCLVLSREWGNGLWGPLMGIM